MQSLQATAGLKRYCLSYPNQEVKQRLTDSLLTFLTDSVVEAEQAKFSMFDALAGNDLDKLKEIFQAFFASIPHDWSRKNQLAGHESYYASIVYCYFAALGLEVHPEEPTNKGRMDLTLRFEDRIYLIEFKVVELADQTGALEVFAADPEAFDLVLTDMDMPEMTGEELSRRLLAIRPDLPVIICTGFSERITKENLKEKGIRAMLMKPFD